MAENCCVPPAVTLALVGVTENVVNVWLTTTLTLLVVARPLASWMVAWKVYVPAWLNVTVLTLLALLPLALKVAVPPVGAAVVSQV